jgi:hypothetical protein
MQNRESNRSVLAAGGLCLSAVAAWALAGCAQPPPATTQPVQVPGQAAANQQTFAGAEEALKALVDAVRIEDREARRPAMRGILGPAAADLSSGDPVADANTHRLFAVRVAEQAKLEKRDETQSVVLIGTEGWPFPVPLVKGADGKWFFDMAVGKEEILARRIGSNELAAISVCRAYVLAQRQYASKDRDGNEVLKYAQRFRSRPGTKNGLYWEAAAGEEPSPFGPLIGDAMQRGYFAPRKAEDPKAKRPFQGYFYRVLKKQGPAVPGGKYDYVINGNMIAGFALVAWPAKYGSSGVMTFTINHQGKLYQKDLGRSTQEIANAITEYNPDGTWTLVRD